MKQFKKASLVKICLLQLQCITLMRITDHLSLVLKAVLVQVLFDIHSDFPSTCQICAILKKVDEVI